ncbi:hypothetical protein [Pseudobutyrivibrio ruminis]|uniref:hypothetical protein n=1 Tax=Pseudobutyrivibrio ruminis TaxID=46206 RepID=UPI003B509437
MPDANRHLELCGYGVVYKKFLATIGGKVELTDRIAYYLEIGKVKKVTKTKRYSIDVGVITEDTITKYSLFRKA